MRGYISDEPEGQCARNGQAHKKPENFFDKYFSVSKVFPAVVDSQAIQWMSCCEWAGWVALLELEARCAVMNLSNVPVN